MLFDKEGIKFYYSRHLFSRFTQEIHSEEENSQDSDDFDEENSVENIQMKKNKCINLFLEETRKI